MLINLCVYLFWNWVSGPPKNKELRVTNKQPYHLHSSVQSPKAMERIDILQKPNDVTEIEDIEKWRNNHIPEEVKVEAASCL